MSKNFNLHGLANDEWIHSVLANIPDDPYKPCPCGCGKAWRYALKDLDKHEEDFINEYIKKHSN